MNEPNESLPPLRLATSPLPTPAQPAEPEAEPAPSSEIAGFRLAPAPEPAPARGPKVEAPAAAPTQPCPRCNIAWPETLLTDFGGQKLCRQCLIAARKQEAERGQSSDDFGPIKRWGLIILAVAVPVWVALRLIGRSGPASLAWSAILYNVGGVLGLAGLLTGFVWMLIRAFRQSKPWGFFCLFSPLLNIAILMGFSFYSTSFKFFTMVVHEPVLAASCTLAPILLGLFVVQHWEIARRPFAFYLLGLVVLAMALFGGPDGRNLSLGEWIAMDDSAAVRVTPDRHITSLTTATTGKLDFNSGAAFTVSGLAKYTSGGYDKTADRLVLKYRVQVPGRDPTTRAVFETRFERLSDSNRSRLSKVAQPPVL